MNYQWIADYEGRICIDGMSLNGTVQPLDIFTSQYFPGAPFLACGGECDCELQPTPDLPTTTATPTIPITSGLSAPLLFIDDVVLSPSNQNPRPKKPQGRNNPDGTSIETTPGELIINVTSQPHR